VSSVYPIAAFCDSCDSWTPVTPPSAFCLLSSAFFLTPFSMEKGPDPF
jgi:hypothetical protein